MDYIDDNYSLLQLKLDFIETFASDKKLKPIIGEFFTREGASLFAFQKASTKIAAVNAFKTAAIRKREK